MPRALRVTVRCPAEWRLIAVSAGDFQALDGDATCPIDRLNVRRSGEAVFHKLARDGDVLIAQGHPCAKQLLTVPIDLSLDIPFSVPPGQYAGLLTIRVVPDTTAALPTLIDERSVEIAFTNMPATRLNALTGPIDFGELHPWAPGSAEFRKAVSAALRSGRAPSLRELAQSAGPIAQKHLTCAWRGRVRSNVPWQLQVQLNEPLQADTSNLGRPRELPPNCLRICTSQSRCIPLSHREPVVVAAGRPTGDDGVLVSLGLRLRINIGNPVGAFHGTISFVVAPRSQKGGEHT